MKLQRSLMMFRVLSGIGLASLLLAICCAAFRIDVGKIFAASWKDAGIVVGLSGLLALKCGLWLNDALIFRGWTTVLRGRVQLREVEMHYDSEGLGETPRIPLEEKLDILYPLSTLILLAMATIALAKV